METGETAWGASCWYFSCRHKCQEAKGWSLFPLSPGAQCHSQTQLFWTRLFLGFDQHLFDPSVSKKRSVNASSSSSVTKRFKSAALQSTLLFVQHTWLEGQMETLVKKNCVKCYLSHHSNQYKVLSVCMCVKLAFPDAFPLSGHEIKR